MAMMSNNSARETELNIFVRSTKMAALVGVKSFCCGWSMNCSLLCDMAGYYSSYCYWYSDRA